MSFVTRFAPTPSGFLHQGNAFHFILTWLIARSNQGIIWLRIDDLDEDRVRPEYLEDIFRSLDWLGLDWDQGPFSPSEQQNFFRQRSRISLYDQPLKQLIESGKLFGCDCSRKNIQRQSPDGSYPGTCREKHLPLQRPGLAWRIMTPWPYVATWTRLDGRDDKEPLAPSLRDVVLRKKDGWPAYQLVSLAEDRDSGITHIVRGEDLRASTACQIWLSEQLGWDFSGQTRFHHHALISDQTGHKLSKSAGAVSLQHLYNNGKSPDTLIRTFARWMGWHRFEGSTASELLAFGKENGKLSQFT